MNLRSAFNRLRPDHSSQAYHATVDGQTDGHRTDYALDDASKADDEAGARQVNPTKHGNTSNSYSSVENSGSAIEEVRDSLPEDLDATYHAEPYLLPDNSRRRIPGILYLVMGTGGISASLIAGSDALLINNGFITSGMVLIMVGLYHLQAGWRLTLNANETLAIAAKTVDFPVGHAAAQLAWRGLRSRPTWRILLYSHETRDAPPAHRGLVLIDGVNGQIVDSFVEDNPEDWTDH